MMPTEPVCSRTGRAAGPFSLPLSGLLPWQVASSLLSRDGRVERQAQCLCVSY